MSRFVVGTSDGWLGKALPMFSAEVVETPTPLEYSMDDVEEHNLSVLKRVRSTGDPVADSLAWEKCQKEFASCGLLGP